MLDSLLAGPLAGVVADALAAAGVGSGPIAVVGPIRLGRALAERGHEVVYVGAKAHTRNGAIARQVQAAPNALPLAHDELAGLVATEANPRADWNGLLAEWQRVVHEGGALVLVARAVPTEMTHRALCCGLTDIEQRRAGRRVITSGRVLKL